MKFNCGPTRREKRNKIWPHLYTKLSHEVSVRNSKPLFKKWFAWYPVRLSSTECAWLEYIECAPVFKVWCDPHWAGSRSAHLSPPKIVISHYLLRASE